MGFRTFRLAIVTLAAPFSALAQNSAIIDINTSQTMPLNANFSGFNDEAVYPVEYYDYNFNNLAAELTPKWVRYPSGLFSQAFNWQTALIDPTWAAEFSPYSIDTLLTEAIPWVGGKGGAPFAEAANRANFLGAKLIVCVNGYTDTPQSAGQMAAYAKANNIPVAVWELSNEPYLYHTFFSSGLDYVTKMKPYRDAIKAADPSAVVAIFFIDAGDTETNPPWNTSVLSYPAPYWDAVTYHHYPPQSTGAFSQWMADENAVLATKSAAFVTGYLDVISPNTKFLISEFLPSDDGQGTGTSLTDGTLYGAVYAAEYMMRMSSVPNMLYVGPHALTGNRGVNAANFHYTEVTAAYQAGKTIDTVPLDFGYFFSAQPLGLAVLNGVLNNATVTNPTTVTGGATVPATGIAAIPALYAQAYTSSTGLQSVVITNKGATAQQVTIRVDGTAVMGTLPVQSISGSDPTANNTAAAPSGVAIASSSSTNPVTVPPYSVVRVDLNTPPAVGVGVNNASYAPGPVASQEIVSLFGPVSVTAASVPTPVTTLGNLTVNIVDSAGNPAVAPIYSVSNGLINVVIPPGVAAGAANLTVLQTFPPTTLARLALSGTLTIASSSPGLYSQNSDGAGVAAAVALLYPASGSPSLETVFTCDATAARSCLGVPLNLGSSTDSLYVELYGTGIRGASSVTAVVNGQSLPVQYAGAQGQYQGLDQVNVAIPKSLAGTGVVRVYTVADGVASNAVSLTFQ